MYIYIYILGVREALAEYSRLDAAGQTDCREDGTVPRRHSDDDDDSVCYE